MTALLWSVGSVGYVAMAVLIGGWRWGTYDGPRYSTGDFIARWPSAFFSGVLWPFSSLLFLAGAYGDRVKRLRAERKEQREELARLMKELP